MHAAEGPRRVDRAVSSPLSIISLGDVGGDDGVTDRATRGTCSAGSGTGLVHYLTGPEITETAPVTVSGLRGLEPLRDGQAHQSIRVPLFVPVAGAGRIPFPNKVLSHIVNKLRARYEK